MESEKSFTVILNSGTQKESKTLLDYRIHLYNVSLFNEELSVEEPATLKLINNPKVIEITNQFMKLQQYNPQPVIREDQKPIKTDKYEDIVTDKKYFQFFQKYTDLSNSEEAIDLINFAKFLNFTELYDAVGAAIAVNYYVGNTEQDIKQFMEKNRLEKLTPSQISQIMDEHADIFEAIEEKSKKELYGDKKNQ